MKLADELQLESGEDAPMSMAAHPDVLPFSRTLHYVLMFSLQGSSFVCGINSAAEMVAKGENLNCRVYVISDNDKWVHYAILFL